jgi:hypothetical protein
MFTRIFSAAAVGAFLLGGLSQPVKANGWSMHRELLTFSAPIALPGVVLAAGTYAFEIPSEVASHTVVRVSSTDGRKIYLTAFTLEVRRPNSADAPKVTFHEAATNAPHPVNIWYPNGDESGKQFIYN